MGVLSNLLKKCCTIPHRRSPCNISFNEPNLHLLHGFLWALQIFLLVVLSLVTWRKSLKHSQHHSDGMEPVNCAAAAPVGGAGVLSWRCCGCSANRADTCRCPAVSGSEDEGFVLAHALLARFHLQQRHRKVPLNVFRTYESRGGAGADAVT